MNREITFSFQLTSELLLQQIPSLLRQSQTGVPSYLKSHTLDQHILNGI